MFSAHSRYTLSMGEHKKQRKLPKLIAEAYPNLSPEQQRQAANNLMRYLDVCRRLYEREQREKADRSDL